MKRKRAKRAGHLVRKKCAEQEEARCQLDLFIDFLATGDTGKQQAGSLKGEKGTRRQI